MVRLIAGGAVLGTLLGWGGSMVFSKWMQTQTGFEMPVSLGAAEFLLVAGLMLGGALIATLPAWLTFRRPIAEGLVSA